MNKTNLVWTGAMAAVVAAACVAPLVAQQRQSPVHVPVPRRLGDRAAVVRRLSHPPMKRDAQ